MKHLHCQQCQRRIAPVYVRNGRTALRLEVFALEIWIDRGDIPCPYCGARRYFSSEPVKISKKTPPDNSVVSRSY